jgi:hypothetical protein
MNSLILPLRPIPTAVLPFTALVESYTASLLMYAIETDIGLRFSMRGHFCELDNTGVCDIPSRM